MAGSVTEQFLGQTHVPEASRALCRQRSVRLWVALLPVVVFGVAVAARLAKYRLAYEIHIDEAAYAAASRNLALGNGLEIFGTPFHLHPPAYFVLLGAVQRALGVDGGTLTLIETLRPVGAVLGAITCVLVYFLARRATGPGVGLLAGLSLAIDPFANRWDSRLLLEAPAMAASAGAVVAALAAAKSGGRRRQAYAALSGLAAGLAITTKEPYFFLAVGPLAVLLVTGWLLPRRYTIGALALAAGVYTSYFAVIVATGQWAQWWAEKSSGVARLIGVSQPTGYGRKGGESPVDRMVETVGTYGGSYLLVGAGIAASVVLLLLLKPWAGTPPPTGTALILVWQFCALAYVSYAVLFGTLEEQTFYMLLAPSAAAASVGFYVLTRRWPSTRPWTALVILSALGVQLFGWVDLHRHDDDGYLTLSSWTATHLPPGTRVAMTEDTGQFVLEGLDIVANADLAYLEDSGADFVLLSTSLVERGYGTADEWMLSELQEYPLVFSFQGRTLGDLLLYDVRSLTGGSSVAARLDLPSVSPGSQ